MIDLRFVPIEPRLAEPDTGYQRNRFAPAWGKLLDDLERELDFLDATGIVVEADLRRDQIRNDGWPRGGCAPTTPGVRVSFGSKHGEMAFSCATFVSMELRAAVVRRVPELRGGRPVHRRTGGRDPDLHRPDGDGHAARSGRARQRVQGCRSQGTPRRGRVERPHGQGQPRPRLHRAEHEVVTHPNPASRASEDERLQLRENK